MDGREQEEEKCKTTKEGRKNKGKMTGRKQGWTDGWMDMAFHPSA